MNWPQFLILLGAGIFCWCSLLALLEGQLNKWRSTVEEWMRASTESFHERMRFKPARYRGED